jgi:hypothetical protein
MRRPGHARGDEHRGCPQAERAGEGRQGEAPLIIEILEVLILAVAAIATAWSGYQAARGDGRQSVLYGESSRDRFEADAAATPGGQRLAADASMFNAWLEARAADDPELQAMFARRFTPEYRRAFEARLQTDSFTDPTAPPGPGYMPEYRNPSLEEARRGRLPARPPTGTCG